MQKNNYKMNKQKYNKNVKEEIGNIEEYEDVTKYGEFVSSFFGWISLEEQKRNARKMEEMSKVSKGPGHFDTRKIRKKN